jgi:altronate dehydratase
METPTENVTETFTGLGATGVDLMLCHTGARPVQAHPMLPLLQISTVADVISRYERDLDLTLDGSADNLRGAEAIYNLIAKTASATYQPKLFTRGVTEFQLTRGLLGLSM